MAQYRERWAGSVIPRSMAGAAQAPGGTSSLLYPFRVQLGQSHWSFCWLLCIRVLDAGISIKTPEFSPKFSSRTSSLLPNTLSWSHHLSHTFLNINLRIHFLLLCNKTLHILMGSDKTHIILRLLQDRNSGAAQSRGSWLGCGEVFRGYSSAWRAELPRWPTATVGSWHWLL